ncbi:unnamed protein product [Gongylonema pulchrum]|uniref:Protein AF-9 homolog n=1 Tax=Gongylonema pulchrum TaxID=637853 RepID=A0A183D908_9BILA|nr:unnamed protein product [Gongylonema pulchrum]
MIILQITYNSQYFTDHSYKSLMIPVVEKPPYEVTETGWGEFEVQIRIFFVDVNEKPVTAFHYLRLFQPQVTLPNGKTMVAAEYYDEIVFQEPTIPMYKILSSQEGRKLEPKRFHTDCKRFFLK